MTAFCLFNIELRSHPPPHIYGLQPIIKLQVLILPGEGGGNVGAANLDYTVKWAGPYKFTQTSHCGLQSALIRSCQSQYPIKN